VKPWAIAGIGLLCFACSSESKQGDEPAIVPEGLSVKALAGGNGVLELTTLTLRKGARGAELYAALINRGDKPACHAALSVELYDEQERSLRRGSAACSPNTSIGSLTAPGRSLPASAPVIGRWPRSRI